MPEDRREFAKVQYLTRESRLALLFTHIFAIERGVSFPAMNPPGSLRDRN
jgi:hypothetical protein